MKGREELAKVTVMAVCGAELLGSHLEAIRRTRENLPFPTRGLIVTARGNEGILVARVARTHADGIVELEVAGEMTRERYVRSSVLKWHDWLHAGTPGMWEPSTHVIGVQSDGYGKRKDRWRDEFLAYDYIGAPWPAEIVTEETMRRGWRVGNSGLTLRSRRFMKASQDMGRLFAGQWAADDVFWCQTHRDILEERLGLRFAPIEVAGRFSLEFPVPECPWGDSGAWGFHAITQNRDHLRITGKDAA